MKKLLLGLLLFGSTVSTFSFDSFIRAGILSGASSYNGQEKTFEHYAPTLSAEITQDFLLADIGAGIAYNGKTNGSEINTVPVYLIARWNLLPVFFEPYIAVKYGTTLYTSDDVNYSNPDGKRYYGIGAGINFDVLQAELLYSNTKIDSDKRGNDNLEQISLTIGYKLF